MIKDGILKENEKYYVVFANILGTRSIVLSLLIYGIISFIFWDARKLWDC